MAEPQPTFQTLDELKPQLLENAAVLEHWKKIRKGSKIPSWGTFDPLDIYEHLPGCMILRIESYDMHRVLLFGTRLANRFGFDISSGNALDLYPGTERDKSRNRTQVALDRPAIILNTLTGETTRGTPMRSETMVLPFVNDRGTIDTLIYSINQFEFDPRNPGALKTIEAGDLSDYGYYDL